MSAGGTIVATAGTFSFHIWKGQISEMGPIPDTYARVGQLGQSSEQLGYEAEPSEITALYLSTTLAGASSFRSSVIQLRGIYPTSITEPNGIVWTKPLVSKVSAKATGGIRNFNGTTYGYVCICKLTIIAQS